MITVEEAFEAAKESAEDYLRKMLVCIWYEGPYNTDVFWIDGRRRCLDKNGDPKYETTWMFKVEPPKKKDTVMRFSVLPKNEAGECLRPSGSYWEQHECAPEDLARRVIEELRSLIELSGGRKPEVMR
jgi:hypothetical protein